MVVAVDNVDHLLMVQMVVLAVALVKEKLLAQPLKATQVEQLATVTRVAAVTTLPLIVTVAVAVLVLLVLVEQALELKQVLVAMV
jgi:hypothetical protein